MPVRLDAALTADAVLLTAAGDDDHVLLVRRGSDPFAGRWALPGGFVEPDETPEAGARRELHEETGMAAEDLDLRHLGVYGAPGRDPRGRVVSAAWWVRLDDVADASALPRVSGGDDAADAQWVPVARALADGALAFDHATILGDALAADAVQRPTAGIAVRFDLRDEAALQEFDALLDDLLPGIRAEEPGTLVYAVHAVDGSPLARFFFEAYAGTGHADHEARPQTARFLERIRALAENVRVEHLAQRGAVRR